jgi:pimeloyl-ACP methyl ester carboxylesterase
MSRIVPYKIAVPQEKLDRLKQKLELSDFPDDRLEIDTPFTRGPPIADVHGLAAYWKDHYDWRKVEENLNRLPHYMTKIQVDGFGKYDVHFVHQMSKAKIAIPLLFLHGWPGSFLEVTKLLPLIEQNGRETLAFHVVAPSLINFGFSSGSHKVQDLDSQEVLDAEYVA